MIFELKYHWCVDLLKDVNFISSGYRRQRANERLGDSPCKVQPGILLVKHKDGRSQEDLLVVHCFSVCGIGALLRDLLG